MKIRGLTAFLHVYGTKQPDTVARRVTWMVCVIAVRQPPGGACNQLLYRCTLVKYRMSRFPCPLLKNSTAAFKFIECLIFYVMRNIE